MRGLLSILSLFHNKLNELNNTRARMLDPIYHMKSHFWQKKSYNCVNMYAMLLLTVRHNVSRKSINH